MDDKTPLGPEWEEGEVGSNSGNTSDAWPGKGSGKPADLRKSFGVISANDMHDSRSDPISDSL